MCTLGVKKKKAGQVSTCQIGPFPCECHVVWWVSAGVSGMRAASVFGVVLCPLGVMGSPEPRCSCVDFVVVTVIVVSLSFTVLY
jgi:hypothetical protein